MRLAVIDIGTNTVQLLIADVDGHDVRRRHVAERFVRLGEGVDASGRIEPAAQDRLLDALRAHQRIVRAHQVDDVMVAGTSALRDATNRLSVRKTVEHELGWTIKILSGATEAAWSFAAACDAVEDLTGPCLVIDIGGGSTELISGRAPATHYPHYPEAIRDRVSLPLGCVRLTERCFDRQPPTPESVADATRLIQDTLAATSFAVDPDPLVIGTAGTATALARVHAGPNSSWDALHGAGFHLSHADVQHWRERLFRLSADDILALHPEAMQGRADVFPVGVLLLDCLLHHFEHDGLHVSPYELRHGLVLQSLAA
ncbi:MAG: exopolyphosphatase [Salinivenus sp.]